MFPLQAFHDGKCIGVIVGKMGQHRNTFRGYIAMLVVVNQYRGKGIGEPHISTYFYTHTSVLIGLLFQVVIETHKSGAFLLQSIKMIYMIAQLRSW